MHGQPRGPPGSDRRMPEVSGAEGAACLRATVDPLLLLPTLPTPLGNSATAEGPPSSPRERDPMKFLPVENSPELGGDQPNRPPFAISPSSRGTAASIRR